MIGSSLLFVHDRSHAGIWLIDFAKTVKLPPEIEINHSSQWNVGNHEDGYLIGINNLITIFMTMLEQQPIVITPPPPVVLTTKPPEDDQTWWDNRSSSKYTIQMALWLSWDTSCHIGNVTVEGGMNMKWCVIYSFIYNYTCKYCKKLNFIRKST